MDGKDSLRKLREILNEATDSGFIDTRTSYDYINEAAYEFIRRTKFLRASAAITTVAGQAEYDLPADFMELYLTDSQNIPFISINNGSTDQQSFWRDYRDVVFENNTTPAEIPGFFTILNNSVLDSRLSGATTSAGASSAGEAVLTDTAADFTTANVGDIVHNVTDGSDGVILSKTSITVLNTALFGGTNNDWTAGDSYVIQPQGRLQLVFDPPTSIANYTVTVHYIERPAPVYSDYGMFRIPSQYMDSLIKYAAWLYKYRDREPNYGDAFYVHFDRQVRTQAATVNGTLRRNDVSVNFKARRRGRFSGR